MINLVLFTLFIMLSAAFAQASVSKQEKLLLCNAVDALLEQQQPDIEVDIKKCLRNRTIESTLVSEGIFLVQGDINVKALSVPFIKLHCELSYAIAPEIGNIIGGLETGVTCK